MSTKSCRHGMQAHFCAICTRTCHGEPESFRPRAFHERLGSTTGAQGTVKRNQAGVAMYAAEPRWGQVWAKQSTWAHTSATKTREDRERAAFASLGVRV